MKHGDFHIGSEFYTSTGKWRCTDVGTRVIVAISLEARTLVRMQLKETGEDVQESFTSGDLRDLVGPPYVVAEHVFDEYNIDGCYTSAAEVPR